MPGYASLQVLVAREMDRHLVSTAPDRHLTEAVRFAMTHLRTFFTSRIIHHNIVTVLICSCNGGSSCSIKCHMCDTNVYVNVPWQSTTFRGQPLHQRPVRGFSKVTAMTLCVKHTLTSDGLFSFAA